MIELDVNKEKEKENVDICSGEGKRPGLCRLLMLHLMFGITYGGNCPGPLQALLRTNYKVKRTLLIIYDWMIIISFAYFEYLAFNKDVFNRLFSKAPNKGVMCVLFKIGAFTLAIDFLVIKFMLLRYGWNTIHTIKSRGLLTVSEFKYRGILIYLAVMSLSSGTLFAITFPDVDKVIGECSIIEIVKTVVFFIMGIFFAMNKYSFTSLILFMSIAIDERIRGWIESLRSNEIKPKVLCESVLDLRQHIEEVNRQIGLLVFVKIIIDAINMSSTICRVFAGNLPLNYKLGISTFAMASLADVYALCYASQTMIDSMAELCKEVETLLMLKKVDDALHKQLYVILSMKNYIKIRVFCLFDLKTVTVLALIGYVANYAIILIQTSIINK